MEKGFDRAERRGRQYWYEDGLTEIGSALLFLAIGILFLVEALSPRGTLPRSFSAIGIVVLVATGIWLVRWGVGQAKSRLTYPRTGFVRYRQTARSPRRRAFVFALAVAVSATLALVLKFTAPASLDWIPAMQGIFIGAFVLYMGYFVGLTRFYLLAALSFGAGPGISLAGFGDTLGNAIYFLVMGAAILLSGSATLLDYLRNTQLPEVER